MGQFPPACSGKGANRRNHVARARLQPLWLAAHQQAILAGGPARLRKLQQQPICEAQPQESDSNPFKI